jgi:hypothetical protein
LAKIISHLLLIAMLSFAIIPSAAISTPGGSSPSLSAFTVSLGPAENHLATPGPDLEITNWTHNVIENPAMEDWFAGAPYRWSLFRSAKRRCWFATDPPDNVSQGTYSAGLYTQSGTRTSSSTQWYQPNVYGDAQNLTLDFDWLCTQVDMPTDSYFQVSIRFTDGRYANYFICGGTNVAASNSSNYGYFHVQEPTAQWNIFSRNITADYLAVPTFPGSLPGGFQVRGVWFYAFSAIGGNEVYAFFDDVYLINGATTHIGGTTQDGNFETGMETPWLNLYDRDHSYVEQSATAHTGTSSANITTVSEGADCEAYIYSSPNYRLTSQNQGNFGFWWHLNLDNVFYGDIAHLYFQYTNFTHTLYMYYYLGYGGSSYGSNTSTYGAINVAGFNTTGSWQYCERNLWQDATLLWGSDDIIVERIFLRTYGNSVGTHIELLVDDIHLTARAIADGDYEDQRDPGSNILGWGPFRNNYFNVTDQAYDGNKAANCSVPTFDFLDITQRLHYRPLNSSRETYLDVMWRLNIYSTGEIFVTLPLNDGTFLNYVFATDNWGSLVNNTVNAYFNVTNAETTGSWYQMHRDLVHDYEEAFGSLPDTSFIEIRIDIDTLTDPLEILFDDLYLYDDPAPLLDDVVLTPGTPVYDQAVIVDLEVKEQDLDMLELGYRIDLGTWNFVSMAHYAGEIYRATIPAQSYNTRVDYFFRANDTWGMYSELPGGPATFNYIVADLTDPDVSINHPSTGTEVTGTIDIGVTASDEASGMDRVEFSVDGSMVGSDSSTPYSYAWDSTTVADGSVTITATAYDNDGNTATDSITLTVNNAGTLPPPPPIPGFPFEAIIIGLATSLGVIFAIRRRRQES